jgi:hypothetical protein
MTSPCIMCDRMVDMGVYGCDDHSVCHACYVKCGQCGEAVCPDADHCAECATGCGQFLCRGCRHHRKCNECAPTMDSIAASFADMQCGTRARIEIVQ